MQPHHHVQMNVGKWHRDRKTSKHLKKVRFFTIVWHPPNMTQHLKFRNSKSSKLPQLELNQKHAETNKNLLKCLRICLKYVFLWLDFSLSQYSPYMHKSAYSNPKTADFSGPGGSAMCIAAKQQRGASPLFCCPKNGCFQGLCFFWVFGSIVCEFGVFLFPFLVEFWSFVPLNIFWEDFEAWSGCHPLDRGGSFCCRSRLQLYGLWYRGVVCESSDTRVVKMGEFSRCDSTIFVSWQFFVEQFDDFIFGISGWKHQLQACDNRCPNFAWTNDTTHNQQATDLRSLVEGWSVLANHEIHYWREKPLICKAWLDLMIVMIGWSEASLFITFHQSQPWSRVSW